MSFMVGFEQDGGFVEPGGAIERQLGQGLAGAFPHVAFGAPVAAHKQGGPMPPQSMSSSS